MFEIDSPIYDFPLIALDLETTGAYPVGDEICEIAFVRYEKGQIVDEFQSLVKPKQRIPEKTIKIHGITNEMVENSPSIEDLIPSVRKTLEDGIFIAHHAPFDLGFMAYEFEKMQMPLPDLPALCSSLLSRSIFPESKNHRLQTLIQFFSLDQGVAHRALDDAKACLEVTLRCIEKLHGPSLKKLISSQGRKLEWSNFSMNQYKNDSVISPLVAAIEKKQAVNIEYQKGKTSQNDRKMIPHGIVRNPDGDFLFAHCLRDKKDKRFYISKILKVEAYELS